MYAWFMHMNKADNQDQEGSLRTDLVWDQATTQTNPKDNRHKPQKTSLLFKNVVRVGPPPNVAQPIQTKDKSHSPVCQISINLISGDVCCTFPAPQRTPRRGPNHFAQKHMHFCRWWKILLPIPRTLNDKGYSHTCVFSYIFWSWYCVSSGNLLEDKFTLRAAPGTEMYDLMTFNKPCQVFPAAAGAFLPATKTSPRFSGM